MQDTVILGYARTPMGSLMGTLKDQSASDLGAVAIRAAVQSAARGAALNAADVDRVLMGSVLLGGQGQAPARQAALKAGLSDHTPCTTISKVCGSGMEAMILGHSALQSGLSKLVIAGGMESMSNAPYLLPKERGGARIGHGVTVDSMFFDGLEDHYGDKGRLMGSFGDAVARDYGFSRESQDSFAIETLHRARAAQQNGAFDGEIAAVATRTGEVRTDEQPAKADPQKIPALRPAFGTDGTITAANASSISDGAAALVLARADYAKDCGAVPIARICGVSAHAGAPKDFPKAPVPAMRRLMDRLGWGIADIDLFEVNEAFAMVAMIAMADLGIPHDKLNVNGGACALGHPIGASGARICVTLLHALETRGLKRGIAGICIGGGEATAIAIERLAP
ncbi:acetyl-CoA C-acyltransferase [Litorivita sp. NS0012-18]|uniref:thiolase family protein n=1 Tax=Litorivita sp. NS0012-18 TaxID=3127655 RepID=UPI00310A48DF